MKNKQKFILDQPEPALKQCRVCFALDDGLLEALDRAARITHVSRSFLVREVLFGWLNDRKLGADS
jgi:predicted transcriptional regulator